MGDELPVACVAQWETAWSLGFSEPFRAFPTQDQAGKTPYRMATPPFKSDDRLGWADGFQHPTNQSTALSDSLAVALRNEIDLFRSAIAWIAFEVKHSQS